MMGEIPGAGGYNRSSGLRPKGPIQHDQFFLDLILRKVNSDHVFQIPDVKFVFPP
jgi:hypothetical protein